MTDSANVELVRSIVAADEWDDCSTTEWAHPEIEYVIADGPSPGRWRGLAGMAGAVREFLSAWDECRVQADEFRELDEERVLAFGTSMRSSASTPTMLSLTSSPSGCSTVAQRFAASSKTGSAHTMRFRRRSRRGVISATAWPLSCMSNAAGSGNAPDGLTPASHSSTRG